MPRGPDSRGADGRPAFDGTCDLEKRSRLGLPYSRSVSNGGPGAGGGDRADAEGRSIDLLAPMTTYMFAGGLQHHADPSLRQAVLRAVPHKVTAEMDLRLWTSIPG
jgi:hypothetical protein